MNKYDEKLLIEIDEYEEEEEEEEDEDEDCEDEEEGYRYLLERLSNSKKEDDQAYYRYLMVFGKSRRIGLFVPGGYPRGVKERGGPINVYNECIEKGVKWEELLNYVSPHKLHPGIKL